MTALAEPNTESRAPAGATEVDVVIVGAGFSGLGMAAALERAGRDDYVILERGDDVGGTWHYNTYPGCGCDVPSHLYSFSFRPNPGWTETYSQQPEIHAYLRRCADELGLREHVRLRTDVTGADWDEHARRWVVQTSAGVYHARVLVAGLGPLAEPKTPDLPGLGSFEGTVFHSARWNHDHDLTGRKVAAVGTGASAIQFVPTIQPEVERLYVVQRTPPWIFPHTNRPTTRLERRLYRRFPALQKLVRGGVYAGRETFVLGFVNEPRLMKVAAALARWHMRRQIEDPELLRKVEPDYTIGCKRILPSKRWYPALGQPNVELLTGGVKEVRPRSIITGDGEEREVDTLIFGTGFHVTDMPVGKLVRDGAGRALDDAWRGSPRAHLGTAVAGFPNLFLLLGPNTGLGHSSMVYMIESQVEYVLGVLRAMDERGARTAEVKAEAQRAYNERVDARMQDTVWNTGCASWYLDDTGRNATLWPDFTFSFRRRAKRVDPAQFELRTGVAA